MRPDFCFKRWSRKKYAAFASMHRVIKIGVVTFSCTLIQVSYQPVSAQLHATTHISDDMELDEVEVSAGQPLPWSSLPFSITTLEQKDIAAGPGAELDDVLEHLPGVDVRQRGPDGIQSDISLNGGSFDQVLILLNGVNITDSQTGHFNLDIPVDLNQIKRIEILRGAAAGLLGSNAFSGAINLITEDAFREKGFTGKAELGTGSFQRLHTAATLSYASNSLALIGSASLKSSDGYITNTDYRTENANLQVSYWHNKKGKFLLQTGYRNKRFGANRFYSLSYPLQFEETSTLYGTLNWDKSTKYLYLQAHAYARRHHDRFELFRDMIQAPTWYTGHNYHLSDTHGGKFTATKSNSRLYSLYGVEYRNEHILSTVLGKALSTGRANPFEHSVVFTKAENRSTFSAMTHQRLRIDPFQTSLGATLNLTPGIGFNWQGGVDALYRFPDNVGVSASLNRSLRLPTFTDLYYQSATQRSNPMLKPEEAITLNGQLDWQKDASSLSLSVFHRWGNDLIDWVKHPDSLRWESRNLTAVEASGFTLEVHSSLGDGIKHLRANDWLPLAGGHPTEPTKQVKTTSSVEDIKVAVSYSALVLDKKANGFDSKYALDYLKHKLTIKATAVLFESEQLGQLTLQVNAGYYFRSGTYSVPESSVLKAYDSYWLTNARLKWARNSVEVFLDGNNLLNVTYYDFGGLSQPGFNVRTGLSVSF